MRSLRAIQTFMQAADERKAKGVDDPVGRELATVSVLAGVGGVEPMAYGHMSICLHLGITDEQLSALLNIVETNLGKTYSEPLRGVLNQLTQQK